MAVVALVTFEELCILPWAESNLPDSWDFRNKTAEDLEPLCFGGFYRQSNPEECKLLYGGQTRAEEALAFLAELGIIGSILHDPGDWKWRVLFTLPKETA